MAFKAQISLTDNSIKEKRSVLFIETLLVDKANTDISTEDKKANIDGYIDLLSSDKRIVGKITVQVKTISKNDEGKNRFPCPTSLFAYAEITTDVVFLLAVDHSANKVLFKHISQQLLNSNRDKENQDTITLHFSADEELRSDNIDYVLAAWLDTCSHAKYGLLQGNSLLKENEELKSKLLSLKENYTTLDSSSILLIQKFSDEYNNLLTTKFSYLRRILFPNIWKRGIAIYDFTDTSLEYSLFNIIEGELISPINQLPPESIFNLKPNHDYASFSKCNNIIKENYHLEVHTLLKKHVTDFIKHKKVIPLDINFLMEYIIDYISEIKRHIGLKKESQNSVQFLLDFLQKKYPSIESRQIHLFSNGRTLYLNTLYDALKCLDSVNIDTLIRPYPAIGSFGNSGLITDSYSLESALIKSRVVISTTFRAYQNFIQSEFPSLFRELDLFRGGNLISILIDYSPQGKYASIQTYYFRCNTTSNENLFIVESITDSEILRDNDITDKKDIFKLYTSDSVIFRGKSYSAFRCEGLSDRTIIFGKFNCLSLFYDILQKRFDEYFEELGVT